LNEIETFILAPGYATDIFININHLIIATSAFHFQKVALVSCLDEIRIREKVFANYVKTYLSKTHGENNFQENY